MAFRLHALPARHGDCIWIEYGQGDELYHVAIDGGPTYGTEALFAKIASLPPGKRRLELLVLTHVDADHIQGAIRLLNRSKEIGLEIAEVWFNGWPQLERLEPDQMRTRRRSPLDGGYAGLLLGELGVPWNRAFNGEAVCVADGGKLPSRPLQGGLTLTVLSPRLAELSALRREWQAAFSERGTTPTDEEFLRSKYGTQKRFRTSGGTHAQEDRSPFAVVDWRLDQAVANGSSIALIAEFAGVRCGLFADAFEEVLTDGLCRFNHERSDKTVRLAAVKMSHHGSKGNVSVDLLRTFACRNFVVSTDGSVFGHPDRETLTLVASHQAGACVYFNYRNSHTVGLESELQTAGLTLQYCYPRDQSGGAILDLELLASRT